MLLQALGLAELLHGNDVAGVVMLEESVRYFDGEGEEAHCGADKAAMMTDRFRSARVLRWKAVTEARRRAVHRYGNLSKKSIGINLCGSWYRVLFTCFIVCSFVLDDERQTLSSIRRQLFSRRMWFALSTGSTRVQTEGRQQDE